MRKDRELSNAEANERRIMQKTKVADLVQVLAFNEEKMIVDVKPIVKREISGVYVSPPPILAVKVAHVPLKADDVKIKPDIKAGDIGTIVYLDLDSDSSIISGIESQPGSSRLHSGDDAVFIGIIIPGL